MITQAIMQNIVFIPFTLSELETLLAFSRALHEFEKDDEYLRAHPFRDALVKDAAKLLLTQPQFGSIWLLKMNEHYIGHCIITVGFSLEFAGHDVFLDELYIEEQFRNQGIGRQVMTFVKQQSSKYGAKAIHLEVDKENLRAQKLYEKFGFIDNDRFLMTAWIE